MTSEPKRTSRARSLALLAIGVGATMSVASCGTSPSAGALPTSITNPLPTLRPDSVAHGGCSFVELADAVLIRDADPDGALIVLLRGRTERHELAWPPGYGVRTYRFGGDFDIIDAGGAIAYTEGESFDRACLAGSPDDPDAILLLAGSG